MATVGRDFARDIAKTDTLVPAKLQSQKTVQNKCLGRLSVFGQAIFQEDSPPGISTFGV